MQRLMALCFGGLLLCLTASPIFAAEKTETAFERIIRTGVIRCGYYVFPPLMYRDPNTGTLSGFSVDYMNRLAERAALKIEWTSEVTWANWIPEIQAGRFDVACTPMWPELAMMKAVTFTEPVFFSGLYPVIRKDDTRLQNADHVRLNQSDVTILTQEGNATDTIAKSFFPQAKRFTLPATADGAEYYQALIAKKADVTMTDRSGLYYYQKNNGENFKMIASDRPIKIQSFPLAVAHGEDALSDFLNQSIREMGYSSDTDRILRLWEPEPGKTYLRVNKPYQDSQ